jgi:hypothetical protein
LVCSNRDESDLSQSGKVHGKKLAKLQLPRWPRALRGRDSDQSSATRSGMSSKSSAAALAPAHERSLSAQAAPQS